MTLYQSVTRYHTSTHAGHVAYLVLGFLIGGLLGYWIGTGYQSAVLEGYDVGQLRQTLPQKIGQKRVCPDAWYDNRMPAVNEKGDQYFIIDGVRAEIDDYDLAWIRAHCTVAEPSVVY